MRGGAYVDWLVGSEATESEKVLRMVLPLIGLVFLVWGSAEPVRADIFRPAYLEITQTGTESYAVTWRVPAQRGRRRVAADVIWPASVEVLSEPASILIDSAWEQRSQIRAAGGLEDVDIAFTGILGSATDVIVRIQRLDGTTQLERLPPTQPGFRVTASPGPGDIAWAYLILGFEHILGGMDHLLFVLALLFLVRSARRLLLTITAFTVAHSITLVSASLGWLHAPGPPVEAIIALSIVFVAAEVIHEQQGRRSLTAEAPWIVAFAFGLLHGLGFAGALEEVGLPETAIPVALLMFNVGVEIGQVFFVAVVAGLGLLLHRVHSVSMPLVSRSVSYIIGSVAAFWTIERVASFAP